MNTSDHICRRAMTVLRERESNLSVSAEDAAFMKSHVAKCPSCLVDSAMIRSMLANQRKPELDGRAQRLEADEILDRLSNEKERDNELDSTLYGSSWSSPRYAQRFMAAGIAAVLVLGIYLVFAEKPSPKRTETQNNAVSSVRESAPSPVAAPGERTTSRPRLPKGALASLQVSEPAIETKTHAQAVLLPDGIKLLVQPDSSLTVQQSDSLAITVALNRGKVVAFLCYVTIMRR